MSFSDSWNWNREDVDALATGGARVNPSSGRLQSPTGRSIEINDSVEASRLKALYGSTLAEANETPQQTYDRELFNANYLSKDGIQ